MTGRPFKGRHPAFDSVHAPDRLRTPRVDCMGAFADACAAEVRVSCLEDTDNPERIKAIPVPEDSRAWCL